MSTNYNILLLSEKKLKDLTLSYLMLVHEIHSKLWNDIEKTDANDLGIIYDNTERRLKRSKAMEEELLDECIWTISKDDPRANHLRFIISTIYSTKDLSRSCEYASSIAKIIVRNKIEKDTIKKLKPITKLYLNHIEQTIKLYKSDSNDKYDKYNELSNEFENQFAILQKESKKIMSNDEMLYYQIIQIGRLILSVVERLQSIFSSTLFSKSNTSTIETKTKKV